MTTIYKIWLFLCVLSYRFLFIWWWCSCLFLRWCYFFRWRWWWIHPDWFPHKRFCWVIWINWFSIINHCDSFPRFFRFFSWSLSLYDGLWLNIILLSWFFHNNRVFAILSNIYLTPFPFSHMHNLHFIFLYIYLKFKLRKMKNDLLTDNFFKHFKTKRWKISINESWILFHQLLNTDNEC